MSDNIDQYMQQLTISRMEKLPKGTINQRTMDGVATVYYFSIKPGQTVYRYDVEITRVLNEVERSQTKVGADDGQKYHYRKICKEAMQIVYNKSSGFGGRGEIEYVYDNRKNLFTNKSINVQKVYQIEANEFPPETARVLNRDYIHVEIQSCQTAQHAIDISDINPSMQTSPVVLPDHTQRMFLELLTSQYFVNSNTHTIVGNGLLFDNNPLRQIENVLVLHDGLAKGVKIVENGDHPVPALVADVKTCAFFEPITLDEAVDRLSQGRDGGPEQDRNFWNRFVTLYHGVRVAPIYDPGRTFVFGSVTSRSLGEITLNKDGRDISLADYYRETKKINIKNPRWPGARPDREGRETTYPLQVLKVLPFQRIPLEKMTEQLSRSLLDANTTQPDVRYNAIKNKVKVIGEPRGECAAFMKKFGVILVGGKNSIEISVRHPPKIKFGDKEVIPNNGKFDERNYNYYKVSTLLKTWVVAYPRNIRFDEVKKFIDDLSKFGRFKGVNLPKAEFMQISLDELTDKMKELSQKRVQFLTYIDQKYVKSHGTLKLNERRFNILTQHVTIEMARKAGPASITNVLNKMHMKIAFKEGLNYVPIMEPVAMRRFDISKGNILVIGLDSSNSPKATPFERYKMRNNNIDMDSLEPSVIGVCANYQVEPWSFCGTYFYQPQKQDAINRAQLKIYIQWVINKVKENKRSPPQIVYIIRDGVSEGHIPTVVKSEFTAIREACNEAMRNSPPKFVFSIVEKGHNKRFFVGHETDRKDNLVPGSVIDSRIIRADIPEFYLQSHKPLKGTGNVPQYVFPINEVGASNDELQAFTNGLCHAFQIVNLAPSLPTPVRIAHELAKRGRNNYLQLKKDNQVPRVPDGPYVDIDRLNQLLSYAEHMFSNTRFNA